MKRDPYFFIAKFFDLVGNKLPANNDKLYKIRFTVDYFRKNCRKIVVPYQYLCIDESLVLFKDLSNNLYHQKDTDSVSNCLC